MTFTAHAYEHGTVPRVGVLLCNLGTPEAPTKKALKPYLKEFLSDPRVIEVNRLLWWFLLNGIILNTRPAKSAALYKKIWTANGSPLLQISKSLAAKVATALNQEYGTPIEIAVGMRYGSPSIANALRMLREKNVTRLVVLPLYPQYSATTTASTFDALSSELMQWRLIPEIRFVREYHDRESYIFALADSARGLWKTEGKPELLVMSFHGMPKRYLTSGDPYHCHCHKTGRLLAERLGLSRDQYTVSFQSLFGKEEWLRPYTDELLKSLPARGIRKVDVICPGFSADCLETLEEIVQLNRENFLHAGGSQYRYIPALNDSEAAVEIVCDIVREVAASWIAPRQGWNPQVVEQLAQQSKVEYERLRDIF